MFTPSVVANLFKVDRQTVKDWSYRFSEYLNPAANPVKGNVRYYDFNDIRVFAYISLYWEEKPDIESIKCGLSSENHFDIELIDDLICQITPLFRELTDNDKERITNIVLIGGMSPIGDNLLELANSYKIAGDKLAKNILADELGSDLACPMMYCYRHAIELYLKSVLREKHKTHKLDKLLEKFRYQMKTDFNSDIPDWFEKIILAFNDFDPESTTFRYGEYLNSREETVLDFKHIMTLIDWFAESIGNIHQRLTKLNHDLKTIPPQQ